MKHRQMMKRLFPLWVSLGLMLFVSGCGKEKSQEVSEGYELQTAKEGQKVILEIKGASYSNADFEYYVRILVGNEFQELNSTTLSRLFDNFIEERILFQAAKDKKMSLTWEEKKEYLSKLRNESWSEVRRVQVSETEEKNLFDKLLVEKYTYELVRGIDVSEDEIKNYYESNKREYLKPERVEVSQILLGTEDKAIEILEQVKEAPEERFREVAREESIGVEASRGGKMGLFEMGELPYEMEKVVFSLKAGVLSPVMESSYGYHIFRLDKRYEPELVSLEKAASSIKVKILDRKIKQYILQHMEDLKESMEWKFFPENLSFPYQRNSS